MPSRFTVLLKCIAGVLAAFGAVCSPVFAQDSILNQHNNISTISSTIPENGDINPYGLVRIPRTVGNLQEGNYLVSNFNASSNIQGTGTTIVQISPEGAFSLFAQINPAALPGPCPGGVGLTTALAVLRTGWVIVGSLPTSDNGTDIHAGCLIVLNSTGEPVETIHGPLINGPWDMTWLDGDQNAFLFVTNVLNGTVAAGGMIVQEGTVVRLNLSVSRNHKPVLQSVTIVGAGFSERTDPAALVIGPTGLGLSPACEHRDDASCWTPYGEEEPVLYVADTLNNRVAVISHPFTRFFPSINGKTLSSGGSLNFPLGLTVAPNGHVITVNGNDGNATEITPQGNQVATKLLDNTGGPPPGVGTLFGLIFDPEVGLIFVDDGSNSLNKLQ